MAEMGLGEALSGLANSTWKGISDFGSGLAKTFGMDGGAAAATKGITESVGENGVKMYSFLDPVSGQSFSYGNLADAQKAFGSVGDAAELATPSFWESAQGLAGSTVNGLNSLTGKTGILPTAIQGYSTYNQVKAADRAADAAERGYADTVARRDAADTALQNAVSASYGAKIPTTAI